MSKIDFVITWVDGSDPVWQNEKKHYEVKKAQDAGEGRYRDMDLLRFWFRAVEKNAPWFNKVYFITWGHIPEWLNTDHPKLKIVKHSDYIPARYLPTFSSHPIELNIHRIKDLSEHFVYFNDDMYITKAVTPEDFFHNGLPMDSAVMNAYSFSDINRRMTDIILTNDMYVINRHFSKKQAIRRNLGKWFNPKYGKMLAPNLLLYPWPNLTGLKPLHVPASYLKSTFAEVWKEEPGLLDETCSHRFRDFADVNPWLMQFWQIMKGQFHPRSISDVHYFPLMTDDMQNQALYDALSGRKYKLICINDGNVQGNYDAVQRHLSSVVYGVYHEKSGFEK